MTYTFKLARRLAVLRNFGVLAVLALLAACNRDLTAPEPGAGDAASLLQVVPRRVTVETNQKVQFRALPRSGWGRLAPFQVADWVSTGGTIYSDGTFQSASVGTFKVVGHSRGRGHSDTSTVVVVPPQTNLVSISIAPSSVTLQTGATYTFTATGHLGDGSTAPVGVTWAATGGTVDPSGVYTAGATAGNYRIIATSTSGALADTAAITLDAPAPTLTSVVVSPLTVSLTSGSSKQFKAYGMSSAGDSIAVTVTYAATGGTVSSTGLYTAGSTAGTFRVIAKSNGLADTAAVSIAASAPAPTPTTGRSLAGGFWNYPSTYCNSDGVTGSTLTTSTSAVLSQLQTAKRCNVRLVIVPGRKFLSSTGQNGGSFSLDSAKAFTDRLTRVLVPDTLRKYDPWIIGFNLADDYQCTACWGGVAVTQSQIAAWASYVREKIPGLRLGVRVDPGWVQGTSLPGLIDYAWAQYHTGKGDAKTYFDKHASLAKSLGLALAMGVNTTNCAGPGTAPCTPDQVRDFMGMAAQYPNNCALLGWTYNSTAMAQAGMTDAWDYVLKLAAQHPDVACKHL
jgi:hypothetical protein